MNLSGNKAIEIYASYTPSGGTFNEIAAVDEERGIIYESNFISNVQNGITINKRDLQGNLLGTVTAPANWRGYSSNFSVFTFPTEDKSKLGFYVSIDDTAGSGDAALESIGILSIDFDDFSNSIFTFLGIPARNGSSLVYAHYYNETTGDLYWSEGFFTSTNLRMNKCTAVPNGVATGNTFFEYGFTSHAGQFEFDYETQIMSFSLSKTSSGEYHRFNWKTFETIKIADYPERTYGFIEEYKDTLLVYYEDSGGIRKIILYVLDKSSGTTTPLTVEPDSSTDDRTNIQYLPYSKSFVYYKPSNNSLNYTYVKQIDKSLPLLSGDKEFIPKLTVTSLPLAYWTIDSRLVDVERGFIYYFQSQDSNTQMTVLRYDLNHTFLDVWDGDLQTPVFREGLTKGNFFSLSEDKTKIICGISLQGDPSNTYRVGYIDIDYNDFPNSPVVYSSNTFVQGNPFARFAALLGDDILYSYTSSLVNTILFVFYNDSLGTISTLNSGIIGTVLSQYFDYGTNLLHCIVNPQSSTNIQYWVYDHNTSTISYQSPSFDTGIINIVNSTTYTAFLLEVNEETLEIAYPSSSGDTFLSGIFDKNLNLLGTTSVLFTPGNVYNTIATKEGNGLYYLWRGTTFRIGSLGQQTKSLPLLQKDLDPDIELFRVLADPENLTILDGKVVECKNLAKYGVNLLEYNPNNQPFYDDTPARITLPVIERIDADTVQQRNLKTSGSANFRDGAVWILNLMRQGNANAVDLLGGTSPGNDFGDRYGSYQNTFFIYPGVNASTSITFSASIQANPPGGNGEYRFQAIRIDPIDFSGELYLCKEDGTLYEYTANAPINQSLIGEFTWTEFMAPGNSGHRPLVREYQLLQFKNHTKQQEIDEVNARMTAMAVGTGFTWTNITL